MLRVSCEQFAAGDSRLAIQDAKVICNDTESVNVAWQL